MLLLAALESDGAGGWVAGLKGVVLWAGIVPLAVANGWVRETWLAERLGPVRARITSGMTLAALVFAFALATIGWLAPLTTQGWLGIGGVWLGMTLVFEFGFGRFVAKKTWAALRRAYTFRDGELWPAVLVVVAVAPWLAAKLRGLA